MDPASQQEQDLRARTRAATTASDRRQSDRLAGMQQPGLQQVLGEQLGLRAGLQPQQQPLGALPGQAPLAHRSAPYDVLPHAALPQQLQQAPGYAPQLGSPWRQPQRTAALPPVASTSGVQMGAYGWLPYPVYSEHLGQPGFFPGDGYGVPYPFMPGYPAAEFGAPSFGSLQGLQHASLGEHFSPNALHLPFGRGRPPRTSKPPEEPSENYDFNLDEALNHPERARKTLMLRNIPNKYTIHMLLETLNKCHKSTADGQLVYDFCYLPIDFKNRCNLGYAFVNFVDAAAAAECYLAFNAKRWNDFNSKKVCEVKYARVQGREALIEHFKNSKFPGNDVDCLPLLFEQTTSENGQKSIRSIPLYSRQLHSA